MAGPWYVRSTDGDNASDGLSWANAKATLAGAASAASAGDTIYVSQAHAETSATDIAITFPGTRAAPTIVLCVDDGAEPPTTLATTGAISTTSNAYVTFTAAGLYCYGLVVTAGNSTGNPRIRFGTNNSAQTFEACQFAMGSTGSNAILDVQSNSQLLTLNGCTLTYSATGQRLNITGSGSVLVCNGCTWAGSAVTQIIVINGWSAATFDGCDLSNAASSMNVTTSATVVSLVLRDCKLPSGWSGEVCSATASTPRAVFLHNSDNADTNYRTDFQTYLGRLTSETTLIRTGGASDGVTGLSWKVATNANPEFCDPFITPEIHAWNDSTGSSKTVTVEILHDSATNLTDAEVWLEVMSLNTSGYPLGTWTSDRKADYLASAADQADSSETWTTTGMSNPNTQKLSVSFTPQEKGVIVARVCVAKASKTLYVDPVLTVS